MGIGAFLLSPKGIILLNLVIDNAIRAWQRDAEEMTEEELDLAIEVAEREKASLDERLATH